MLGAEARAASGSSHPHSLCQLRPSGVAAPSPWCQRLLSESLRGLAQEAPPEHQRTSPPSPTPLVTCGRLARRPGGADVPQLDRTRTGQPARSAGRGTGPGRGQAVVRWQGQRGSRRYCSASSALRPDATWGPATQPEPRRERWAGGDETRLIGALLPAPRQPSAVPPPSTWGTAAPAVDKRPQLHPQRTRGQVALGRTVSRDGA